MVGVRLDELCARYRLDDRQRAQLAGLLEALRDDQRAPSSVTDPAAAVDVHLADSLAALELGVMAGAGAIADLGSGAGLPGLPLAVALPQARVACVESAARKAEFIERARSRAGIDNAVVVAARAEEWRSGFGEQDVVTARALARLPVVCEYAAPLLREGGALVVWRGERRADEERAAELAAAELGLQPQDPVRSAPYAGSESHYLHVYLKVQPTPPRFPRRPGMARKRPLGGST
jgi:16S rRNA (guanine527-N7)-methyltransferase